MDNKNNTDKVTLTLPSPSFPSGQMEFYGKVVIKLEPEITGLDFIDNVKKAFKKYGVEIDNEKKGENTVILELKSSTELTKRFLAAQHEIRCGVETPEMLVIK